MLSYQYRKSHCGDKMDDLSTVRLISTMGFPILVKWHLYVKSTLGHCLNIKMSFHQYRNSHYKDKAILWLIMKIPYMERQSLYWDMAQKQAVIQYKDAVLWVKECPAVQKQWSSNLSNWVLCTVKMTSLQGSTHQEIFTFLTSKILHYS